MNDWCFSEGVSVKPNRTAPVLMEGDERIKKVRKMWGLERETEENRRWIPKLLTDDMRIKKNILELQYFKAFNTTATHRRKKKTLIVTHSASLYTRTLMITHTSAFWQIYLVSRVTKRWQLRQATEARKVGKTVAYFIESTADWKIWAERNLNCWLRESVGLNRKKKQRCSVTKYKYFLILEILVTFALLE